MPTEVAFAAIKLRPKSYTVPGDQFFDSRTNLRDNSGSFMALHHGENRIFVSSVVDMDVRTADPDSFYLDERLTFSRLRYGNIKKVYCFRFL